MIARIAVLLFALSASGAEAHAIGRRKPVPDWVRLPAADRRTLIIFARNRSIGRPTTITRSTVTSVASPSVRRCRARMETTGSSTGTMAAEASPGSTASSCRWISDARSFRDRHMRGQTRRDRAAARRRYWRQGPLGPSAPGRGMGLSASDAAFLMGLLFVGGLMNLLWSAGLALLVLIEKLFPLGPRVAQLTGVALIGWGAFVLVH